MDRYSLLMGNVLLFSFPMSLSFASFLCSFLVLFSFCFTPVCSRPPVSTSRLGVGWGWRSSQTKPANYRQVRAIALVSPPCLEPLALLIEVNVYLPTRPFHCNTKEKAEATQTMSGYAGRTLVFSRGHPELSNLLRDFFFFFLL